ncbi:MAG: 3-oxoacyl-acyl-carrier-protein synthase II [Candidatus Saganbacteria bacterium]|uniref:Nodulation protein E n=1 Tax=Candidatus Saganbacteria bacterium TaxID=2575572 RepID=A0A833L1H5_UNCSA|nr:MAG: 3-oxoacyl-acyl-carrier-protein synthase II [Candidatus Saganbacteria bacterium]
MKRRVVITGIGAITPLAIGVIDNWNKLIKGTSGVKKIGLFGVDNLKIKIGGELTLLEIPEELKDLSPKTLDRSTIFAIIAVNEALKSADLHEKEKRDLFRIGIILGTGFGTIQAKEGNYVNILEHKKPMYPLIIPKAMDNAPASEAAIYFGLKGINLSLFTACSSGTNAIGTAFRLIRDNYEDTLIAGGVDTPITYHILDAWSKLRVLSKRNDDPQRASCPFSKNRDGFVLSEGAGFMVMESYERAQERKAMILAEIVGYGATCDALHVTAPDYLEQSNAISLAIKDAGVSINDIDYISAHGTATKLNDATETKAIKRVFKDRSYEIPISALKSQIGHTIGASGAIESIFAIQMMRHNILLPTINYTEKDEECDLNYIPNKAVDTDKIKYVLKNSFGFGGSNASIVLKNYPL